MTRILTAISTLAICGAAVAARADENSSAFQKPQRLLSLGKPIDAPMGNAAPCYADFDGDGIKDLLVGQFEKGKLQLYRNLGTNSRPRFDKPTWFLADGAHGTVPAG